MYQVILTGSQKQIDRNYDKLFTQLDNSSFLENKTSSENEYNDNDRYIVEFKHLPQEIQEWVEERHHMDLVLG